MEKSITTSMLEEHLRIKGFLRKFEQICQYYPEEAKEIFYKFKWNLEKHFFVEEKAIFMLYEKITGEEVSDIFDLIQEHGDILLIVKSIEYALENCAKLNLLELIETLTKHAKFEDEVFYPKLDYDLSAEQRKEIIKRINEVLIG